MASKTPVLDWNLDELGQKRPVIRCVMLDAVVVVCLSATPQEFLGLRQVLHGCNLSSYPYPKMKEILYIQAGNTANYIGTHFWNTQESYLASEDPENSRVDATISFRNESVLWSLAKSGVTS